MNNERKTREVTIDIIVFFAEAMATNPKIKREIAEIYESCRFEAYNLAKNSEFYNHPIFCDGDIEKEFMSKKSLGIYLYLFEKESEFKKKQDEGIATKEEQKSLKNFHKNFYGMIEKGWPGVFRFLKSRTGKKVHPRELEMNNLVDRHKMTDDEINAVVVIFLQLSIVWGIEIEEGQDKQYMVKAFEYRQNFSEGIYPNDVFCYEKADEYIKRNGKLLKKRIFEHHAPIIDSKDVFLALNKESESRKFIHGIDNMLALENLMWGSVADMIELTEKDVDEACAMYFWLFRNKNVEEGAKFVCSSLMFKQLARGFKNVKRYFFENNKENMYLELEGYIKSIKTLEEEILVKDQQLNKARSDIAALRKEYRNGLEKRVISLEKENKKLEEDVSDLKSNNKELFALREYAFEKKKEKDSSSFHPEAEEPDVNIDDYKILIAGGHENWQRKVNSEISENIKFLSGLNANFDTRRLKNYDLVIFETVHSIKHKVYVKAINKIRKMDEVSIGYLENPNMEKTKAKLLKIIEKRKNDIE